MPMKYQSKLMEAISALNAVGGYGMAEVGGAVYTVFLVVFSAGVASGTVVIEEAHDSAFTGTWANLGTVAWAAADRVHSVVVAGPHRAIRARVSVVIAGGTVDVYGIVSGD